MTKKFQIRIDTLYKVVVTFILTWDIIINSLFKSTLSGNLYKTLNICIFGFTIIVAIVALLSYKRISLFIYVLFIVLMLSIWHSFAMMQMIMFVTLFIPLTPIDTVYIYKYGILLGVGIVIVLSLIGVISKYGSQGGHLALGFDNENITGFYLIFLSVLFFIKKKDTQTLKIKYNIFNVAFFLIAFSMDYHIFKDGTAIIIPVVFMLTYFVSRNMKVNFFSKVAVSILPLVLILFSIWVGLNFGRYNWLFKLNQLLTLRPFIWHYYLTNYPVGPFNSNWMIDINWVNGAFDGSYVYWIVFNGYIFTCLVILGLIIANWKLVKNHCWILLSLLVTLEIVGFSENIFLNFYQCFGLVFALLAFNARWYKVNNLNKSVNFKNYSVKHRHSQLFKNKS